MTPLPDLYDYSDPEAMTPPDEDGDCPDCGRYSCPTWCRPSFVSPYLAARSRARVENGDPES